MGCKESLTLGWPGEIARVETESTVLHAASTHANGVDAGAADLPTEQSVSTHRKVWVQM